MKKASVFNQVIPALGLGLIGQLALAGNITDINVSAFPNNQKIVKIKFDKGVVLPKASAVGGATQLAFDFPATACRM